MNRALQLAEKGRGKTKPNPLVGAVLVKNGNIIGEGYHKAAGKDHAEIVAFNSATESARGATLYVNLEPCCHVGRTGPCTDRIISEKIKKVVIASKDPNRVVNGKGIRILKKAGIDIVSNVLKKEAFFLNDAYLSYHSTKKPFITLKMAQTLDGKIADIFSASKYLSSAASLKYVHLLRAEVDAVAVGANTVRNDNPKLDVRLVKGENPYRIILSTDLNFKKPTGLLNQKDHKTIIASTEQSINKYIAGNKKSNLIYWSLREKNKKLDLHDFVEKAAGFGLHSILIEGGSALAGSFLKEGLIDKLILVTVPKIMGDGVDTFSGTGIKRLKDAIQFSLFYNFQSGTDTIFVGYSKGRG